jgi:hypothetical protein
MKYNVVRLLVLLWLSGQSQASEIDQMGVPIPNAWFDFGGGIVPPVLHSDTRAGDPGPTGGEVGRSGWFGSAEAAPLRVGGHFRPGFQVDDAETGAGVARIFRHPPAGSGRLAASEAGEAVFWAPLPGVVLEADCAYTFSIDVDPGSGMDSEGFRAQGFALGVTTNASGRRLGDLCAESSAAGSRLQVIRLKGTNHRVSLHFITSSQPPAGDVAVVIFARRVAEEKTPVESCDFTVDNAALSLRRNSSWMLASSVIGPNPATEGTGPFAAAVFRIPPGRLIPVAIVPATPEPSATIMLIFGGIACLSRRSRRSAPRAVPPPSSS